MGEGHAVFLLEACQGFDAGVVVAGGVVGVEDCVPFRQKRRDAVTQDTSLVEAVVPPGVVRPELGGDKPIGLG